MPILFFKVSFLQLHFFFYNVKISTQFHNLLLKNYYKCKKKKKKKKKPVSKGIK